MRPNTNKFLEDNSDILIRLQIIIMFEALSIFFQSFKKTKLHLKKQILVFNTFLKDTEILYTLGTQNVLDLLCVNKTYTWDVKVQLMGLQREDVSKRIVEIYDLPITWEEYADMIQEQIEDLMTNCKLCPGN